jgi:hypothetical protein
MSPEPEQPRTPKRRRKLKWERAFLAELGRSGNVSAACLAAGIGRTTAYDHAERHADFQAAWDEALETACDRLELEARRRAHDGVDEPVIYKGELCGIRVNDERARVPEPVQTVPTAAPLATDAPDAEGDIADVAKVESPPARFVPLTVKKYSDSLLMFLLKAHRPDKFRERQSIEHTGKDGGPITYQHDLSKLTNAELRFLEDVLSRVAIPESGSAGIDEA